MKTKQNTWMHYCFFHLLFYSQICVYRIFTLYTKSLPLDVACRVWDVFCRDGEEFLFRTGLGILRLYEEVLLQMDFIHIAQFLTRLPEDTPSERLFSCIANTQMISSNRKWTQVSSCVRCYSDQPVEFVCEWNAGRKLNANILPDTFFSLQRFFCITSIIRYLVKWICLEERAEFSYFQ